MGGHILVHAVATGVTHCKIGLRFYQIIGIVVSIVKWFEKVFHEEESDYMFPVTPAVFWRVVISGMVGGVVTWLIALALDHFILKQIICGPTADPSMCTNSAQIGAYVALVLVSVMLVPIIALYRVRRPLLVVLAASNNRGVWLRIRNRDVAKPDPRQRGSNYLLGHIRPAGASCLVSVIPVH